MDKSYIRSNLIRCSMPKVNPSTIISPSKITKLQEFSSLSYRNSFTPIHSRKNIRQNSCNKQRLVYKSICNKTRYNPNQSICDEPAGLTVRTFALESNRLSPDKQSQVLKRGKSLKRVFKIPFVTPKLILDK